MNNSENLLQAHLREFRRKFYINRMMKGSVLVILLMSSILFVSITGEGLLGFSSGTRTLMITLLGLIFTGAFGFYIAWPFLKLINITKPISDYEIAGLVKRHFPEVNDKLINLLELKENAAPADNSLLFAAISSKTEELSVVQFSNAINFNVNLRYIKYLGIPLLLFLVLALFRFDILTNGTTRLINFNQEFIPPPPFLIDVQNHPDQLISGQDFQLDSKVKGDELPSELFLYLKKESESDYIHYPMEKEGMNEFYYMFSDIKENFNYYLGNEEVKSDIFGVEVLSRPSIRKFRVLLDYPAYTGIPSDTLGDNVGDFKALRGTKASWLLETNGEIRKAKFFGEDTTDFSYSEPLNGFIYGKNVLQNEEYFISLLSNRNIPNIDTVRYHLEVVQDRFPGIYVNSEAIEYQADFTMFMPLDFEISDDFGFSKLSLFYRFKDSENETKLSESYQEIVLKVSPRELLQQKSMELDLMTLGMEEGDLVEYFVKVWDNDAISGYKASMSSVYRINFPSINKKYEEIDERQEKIEEEVEKVLQDVKDIKETLDKFQEKMLDQKDMSYDDKKELQNMLDKHDNVKQQLEKLQKEFNENKEFLQKNEMITEKTLEKYDKVNELMEKLQNEELNKFMEKLQKQMEKMDPKEMKEMMENMEFQEKDLEEALERTLELLKQLDVQQKAEEILNKLDNLQKKQDMLNEKLENTNKKDDAEMKDIADKQEKLSEEMEKISEEMKELGDMKKETSTPDSEEMSDLQKDAEDTQQQMQDASDQIQQNDKKSGSQGQKNSSQKMEEMKQSMQSMMMQSQSQQDQQNLDDLRDLLENLLKLSFRQEDLRDEVKELRNNDPLVQKKEIEQRQMLDDMMMVKDSLDELAKRAFQIEKFVTDESNKIVRSMESASNSLDNKQLHIVTKDQHESMTSINNLANMLTDVMDQIQQQMKNQSGGMGMCKNPGGNRPNMQQLSKQQGQLNNMMQQMMQNGGKGMDPNKLAEMAKMQEMIRKQLKDAHQQLGEDGNSVLGDLGQIMKEMEDTEDELNNKILTERTMQRQRQILNRLLDSFKAVREKEEFEEKRKSNTGEDEERKSPDQLELEGYKNKIRQELLKSNQLEYSSDFIILIEKYFKLLEKTNE